jgi:nucleoside phosphorylase
MQYEKLQTHIESKKIRINQKGGERKPKLEIREKVSLCLFYLGKMPTFEVLGLHVGISKTEAKHTFHYYLEILVDVLVDFSPASFLE